MTLTKTQLSTVYLDIINEQIDIFNRKRSITERNQIPSTTDIPLDNQTHWLKIPGVICVYIDMKGSTQLSATTADNHMAGVYQLYTGTAVRLLNAFDASYIDVRGDGAFGLFNSNQVHRALAAAVTFKTFANGEFVEMVKNLTDLTIGSHIGIDQKTVLVRRIGFRKVGDRDDRQNEVWAGKPVNMAAKLASITDDDEIYVSDRYYAHFSDEHVLKSCGCGTSDGSKRDLWEEKVLEDDPRFDFEKAYVLKSHWCPTHGKEFCDIILNLDEM